MIVLFTDFGLHGPYTGQMKAVLNQTAPGVPIIDLFADAPVGNPKASAYLLAVYATWFPPGTVFLCVVDPGVGGARPASFDNWRPFRQLRFYEFGGLLWRSVRCWINASSSSPIFAPMMRATVSVGSPAAKESTMRTGFDGYPSLDFAPSLASAIMTAMPPKAWSIAGLRHPAPPRGFVLWRLSDDGPSGHPHHRARAVIRKPSQFQT
jgi:hypothetical protein